MFNTLQRNKHKQKLTKDKLAGVKAKSSKTQNPQQTKKCCLKPKVAGRSNQNARERAANNIELTSEIASMDRVNFVEYSIIRDVQQQLKENKKQKNKPKTRNIDGCNKCLGHAPDSLQIFQNQFAINKSFHKNITLKNVDKLWQDHKHRCRFNS